MNIYLSREEHIQNVKTKISYIELILMMGMIIALNCLAIDIILPALHQISSDLNAKNANDQHYLLFMYLIGFGLAHLIFGFFSDRFGRKKPLLCGLIIYCIAAFMCNMTTNYSQILALRFLQGAGAASTNVLTMSIARDLYSGKNMASIMSAVFLIFVIFQTVAPAIGQFLLSVGDWHLIFIFMGVISLLTILWIIIRLPETLYVARKLDLNNFLYSCKIILTNRKAVFYTLAAACLASGFYALLNMSKQIFMDIFHLDKSFSLAFAFVIISQAISATLNSKFVKYLGLRNIAHSIIFSYMFAAIIMIVITIIHNGTIEFLPFIILLFIIMFSHGVVSANFNALAMENLGNVAGAAASFVGFSQITIASFLGLVIAQQFNGTIQPLAIGFFIVSFMALCFVLYAEKGKLFKSN